MKIIHFAGQFRRTVCRSSILRIMKLTVAILIIGLTHVTAAINAQITIKEKNIPLQTALKTISQQSGYDFIYSDQVFRDAHPVTLNLSNAPIETALNLCFKDQPLTYKIEDKTVMVRRKAISEAKTNKSNKNNITTAIQAHDVRIHITDSTGQPLSGASVTVKGSKQGGSTDAQGNITLAGLTGEETLIVAYIGYESKEINTRDRENIAVVLKVSTNPLDEMQVIAYGTTSKRFSTGNISTVTSDEIEKSPVSNVLLAIQGRVPGIFIKQATGFAGTGVSVRVQGQNSISSGNEPFYVVDGVPYSSQLLPQVNNIQGGTNSSPLNYLNPDDIESISILKDADATSIYGSRAANGAILITTKKGRAGDTRINLNIQQGVGSVTRKMDVLNTPEYLKMRWMAFANDSLDTSVPPFSTNYKPLALQDLLIWDTTRYTDWQKVLIGNTAHYTDGNLSFSGGNNNTSYMVGGNYHRETTVMPGDFSDERASVHFNVQNTSNNQRLHLELSGSYLRDNNHLPGVDLTNVAIELPPDAPALYNPDGSLNWAYYNGRSTWTNPLNYIYGHYDVTSDNLIGNALISYRIFKGLTFKSTFGYTDIKTKELNYSLDKAIDSLSLTQGSFIRSANFGNNDIHTWDMEPQLVYNSTINNHHFNALVGSSFQETNSYRQAFNASGFNSDAVLADISAATTIQVSQSIATDYKYNAVFARLGYDYDHKYILNLNARRDGSSRFGSENRFHNFASAAGAWLFSEENFIKSKLGFLSFGKLRASYGTTGNDQIGDYAYLSLYNNLTSQVPYQTNSSGLYPRNLPNPYLQWELTKKLQFGLDLGFVHDRILMNLNYNLNRSSNQLLGYNLPFITGFGNITSNLPATVQNTGWEITLSTENIHGKKLQWNTSFNITIPQNKLVAFPNLENSSYANSLIIGKSIDTKRYYKYAGVNPETGMYQFLTALGELSSSPSSDNTDKTVLLNTDPKYYGGLENSVSYKGFQLDFLFQFASQAGQNYSLGLDGSPGSKGVANLSNQSVNVLSAWQKQGDRAAIQLYATSLTISALAYDHYNSWSFAQTSDKVFSTINYVRLKNLSFSWQIPKHWIKNAHIENARIYLQGQNLLTFTNYIGLDPETQGLHMPPLRIITMGLNVTL